ncbi:protein SSUH2 homolog [Gastrophryne carolinensis]
MVSNVAPLYANLFIADFETQGVRKCTLPIGQSASSGDHGLFKEGLLNCRNVEITEVLAREALLRNYAKCCCLPPRDEELIISKLTQMPLYRYKLESFIETRQQEKTGKPYTGQKLDGPQTGALPQLWDISVQTPAMFNEGSQKIPLPHSSELKVCNKCQGRGRCRCPNCGGSGQFRCRCSSGSRQRSKNKRCHACSGSHRRRCSKCSGRGRKVCSCCKGEGRLIHYQQLSVTWKTLQSEYISSPPDPKLSIPITVLKKVSGEVIVKNDGVTVSPLPGFEDSLEVPTVSQRLIQEHHGICGPSSHLLRQQQMLEVIPVAHVQYEYRGKSLTSHVYGRERRVLAKLHLPRLPCGCAVM